MAIIINQIDTVVTRYHSLALLLLLLFLQSFLLELQHRHRTSASVHIGSLPVVLLLRTIRFLSILSGSDQVFLFAENVRTSCRHVFEVSTDIHLLTLLLILLIVFLLLS